MDWDTFRWAFLKVKDFLCASCIFLWDTSVVVSVLKISDHLWGNDYS